MNKNIINAWKNILEGTESEIIVSKKDSIPISSENSLPSKPVSSDNIKAVATTGISDILSQFESVQKHYGELHEEISKLQNTFRNMKSSPSSMSESWGYEPDNDFQYSGPENFSTVDSSYRDEYGKWEKTPEYKRMMKSKRIDRFSVDNFLRNFQNFEFVIPDGIVEIEDYAFAGTPVVTVTIPSSVRKIGERAFLNCENLASIVLPNDIDSIREKTFYNCKNLKSIELPKNLHRIGYSAFEYCESLENIGLPKKLETIKKRAFANCRSLKSVDLPESIDGKIRIEMFEGCESLENVRIPSNVREIRNGAFKGCSSLKSIDLPDELEYISSDLFKNCKPLTKIKIPKNVRGIGSEAFDGCNSLKMVVIPSSVEYIAKDAFKNCPYLHSVVPEGRSLDDFKNIRSSCYSCEKSWPFGISNPAKIIKEKCSEK